MNLVALQFETTENSEALTQELAVANQCYVMARTVLSSLVSPILFTC